MNRDALALNRRVMERVVNWDPSIRFPVDETIKVLKFLYGSAAVVLIMWE